MRPSLPLLAALLALLAPSPGATEGLPGVWFLNARGTGADDDLPRLAVGGTELEPPTAREEVCLGWVWSEPRPDVDPYPDAAAGTFRRAAVSWSLTAGGATTSPSGCRPPGSEVPFPQLGIGAASELWLLQPAAERDRWPELLHAVEAAWRQSAVPGPEAAEGSPLGERAIGVLGRCTVRSLAVDLGTRLDRWLPVELPGHARPSEAGGALFADPAAAEGQAPERTEMVRVRRFLRWVEAGSAGESCLAEGEFGTLRLFPRPAAEGEEEEAAYFLTIAEVEWRRLTPFDLDPEDWSPSVRRLVEPPAPETAPAGGAGPEVLRLTAAEHDLLRGPAVDLCRIGRLGELCRRDELARRQLSTAIAVAAADPPWPAGRLRAAQQACEATLGPAAGADACADAALWGRPIAGPLVAGFQGEAKISARPTIRETWSGGRVAWRLQAAEGDALAALTAAPAVELRLLDGTRLAIRFEAAAPEPGGSDAGTPDRGTPDRTPPDRSRWAALQPWAVGGAAGLAVFAALYALLWARRPTFALSPQERREVMHALTGEAERLIDARVESANRRLEAELRERAVGLVRQLAESDRNGRATLEREAQTLSEGLRRDLDARSAEALDAWREKALAAVGELAEERIEERLAPRLAELRRLEPLLSGSPVTLDQLTRLHRVLVSHPDLAAKLLGVLEGVAQESLLPLLDPFDARVLARPRAEMERRAGLGFDTLAGELGELADGERQGLTSALEAAGQLGYWADQLWPHLARAAGGGPQPADLESVAAGLPEPAAAEWRHACRTLRRFALFDAVALRRLRRRASGPEPATLPPSPPSPAEAAFLERSGLLDGERPLSERLKRYLEPFDQLGRLGEVTLALQYLLEAYPVEQLTAEGRAELRRKLGEALRSVHLEEDFHRLVAATAAGVGLRYRPVRYYKSRIDQGELAFVRQQVSPISLSDRVGFAATAEPTVVVRLERPFFFQLETDVYYAGHAHVARG